MDLTGNAREPVTKLNFFSFNSQNGNGVLNNDGNHDISVWNASSMVNFIDQAGNGNFFSSAFLGFRYCRSAE
jgi:hypothetical protein